MHAAVAVQQSRPLRSQALHLISSGLLLVHSHLSLALLASGVLVVHSHLILARLRISQERIAPKALK